MEELIRRLNEASEAYYGGRDELLSNYEWDAMFDELGRLEAETGVVLPESPTQKVSAAAQDNIAGAKEKHEYPALSLAKTKKVSELQAWAGAREVWLSWKLDGLTLVLSYDGGRLTRILTRGNGETGTNISFLADALRGFPREIAYAGHLVVRGEATISYPDFEAINAQISDPSERFANPRNLASGTLALDARRLDEVRQRRVTFNAFTLVHLDKEIVSWGARMDFLDALGFTTVERERTDAASLPEAVARWTARVESGGMPIPVDGLVLCYDDTVYAATGSVTGHHATRAGIAFKWADERAVTTLRQIEWSCGATTITPVAIFDPVQLEGTTVSRASLVNLSELERLGVGEPGRTEIEVIKANKIIPKCIAVREAEGRFTVPDVCPVCGRPTAVTVSPVSGTKVLRCTNAECPAKHLNRFARFVSKPGMDIDGISVRSLLAFINRGFLASYPDIYRLGDHAGEIVAMEGFGEKSVENLLRAVEKSRDVSAVRLIYALCIPMIGADAAKQMIGQLGTEEFFRRLEAGESFEDVDGIGPERSRAVLQWASDPANREMLARLLTEVRVAPELPKTAAGGRCEGITFVITGDVHVFRNRDHFKAYVEEQGGTVAGSVSGKTRFLINNDPASGSSKNRKARELGVPILSEEEFISRFGFPED
jgi:DNA ligase (NAD+)